ncbi:MAG: DUF6134 family protein [Bacteroidota bacterium]
MKNALSLAVVFTVASLLASHTTQAQRLTYKVVWKGDSIGYLIADKQVNGNSIHYDIDSEVKIKFFFGAIVNYTYNSHFKNGILMMAETENLMNKKRRSHSIVERIDKDYKLLVDKKEKLMEDTEISSSISAMYYEEPVGLESIFSERYAVFSPIKLIEPGKYELTKPDGRKNYYHYKNGDCIEVQVNNTLTTIYFQLLGNGKGSTKGSKVGDSKE